MTVAPAAAAPARLAYGDWVRVLGTLAVVLAHCLDFTLYSSAVSRGDWWTANALEALSRWAVPVYVMLSGAILLDPVRSEPPLEFYRKRLSRVGLPLLVWVPFFVVFGIFVIGWSTWPQVREQLLYGEPYGHLHFVVRILGLYAITPMLRVFTAHASRPLLAWTVVLALGLGAINSAIDGFTGQRASAAIRFVPFIGWFLAGWLLRDVALDARGRVWAWIGLVLSAAAVAVPTGLMVPVYGIQWYPSVPFITYDFLSLPRIGLGLCAWLVLTDLFRSRAAPRWLAGLAAATLGIYIIHPLFRDLAVWRGWWKPEHGLWPGFLPFYLGVYGASVLAVLALLRVPYLRRIVG